MKSLSIISVLFICIVSVTAAAPLPAVSTGTRIQVDGSGAFAVSGLTGDGVAAGGGYPAGEILLPPPAVQWIIGDGGLDYIPYDVAIGAGGGLALWGDYLNNERAALFSTTTNDDSEALVWEDTELYETLSNIYCAASDETDRFVAAARFEPVRGSGSQQTVLYGYGSGSAVPEWVYAFPLETDKLPRIKMSKDGSLVVAVLNDDASSVIEITCLDADTGTLEFTDSLDGGFVRVFDMSDDGSLLYIFDSGNNRILVYDTDAGEIIYTGTGSGGFDSHAISGDGSAFAFGGFGTLKYYEWDGATYVWKFTHAVSGLVYCARCDLSTDGGVLAAAFYNYGTGLDFSVLSLDGATGDVLFQGDFTGGGGYQNYPADIRVTGDGSRIVYGGWGDQFNTNPEVMVFDGDGVPAASIDTRGSVFSVDISTDGQYVVSGSKSIHANVSGRGGDHACLYMGGEELAVNGVPRLSSTVAVTVEGEPGETVLLAGSLNEVEFETAWGVLRVDPDDYYELGEVTIPGSGVAEFEVPVPAAPPLAGKKAVIQALITGGGNPRFTNARIFWFLP